MIDGIARAVDVRIDAADVERAEAVGCVEAHQPRRVPAVAVTQWIGAGDGVQSAPVNRFC